MRVIAGTARSMPLKTVKGMDVRPTTDRSKETLFNILQTRVPGSRFLDLYAGSGSIGIEALSRGADFACFVERDRRTCALIEENLVFTKLIDRAKILKSDVLSAISRLEGQEPFDIIFMDPPFRHELEKEALTMLSRSRLLKEGGIIVVEAWPKTDFSYLRDFGFRVLQHKIYSQSSHLFLEMHEK